MEYSHKQLCKMVDSSFYKDRVVAASHGYGLETLINDEHPAVREAVAGYGYGLDVLVCDEDSYVRRAVAKQGYGLNILVNDENWQVAKVAQERRAELGSVDGFMSVDDVLKDASVRSLLTDNGSVSKDEFIKE